MRKEYQLESKTKRVRIFGVVFIAAVLSLFALYGCSSSNETASGESDSVEVEASNPLQIDGVYHTLTGMNEPKAYGSGTGADYDTAKANLSESQANSDEKILYVAVSVTPDERENIHVGAINGNMRGGTVSDAKLVIDNINDYGDIFGLNKSGASGKVYYPVLREYGYRDGADQDELLGGSEKPYRAIFMFDISNTDFEKGEVGYFTWGSFSTEIDMSTVKTVDTPLDMAADLAALQ